MTWVKQGLEAVIFTLETIQMMMFIMEETCQTASMAMGTALTNGKFELAQEIMDTTLVPSNNKLFEFVVMYAMVWIPSWNAFLCFQYCNSLNVGWLGGLMDDYKKLRNMGYNPPYGKGKRRK
jgi:hypothetical protein